MQTSNKELRQFMMRVITALNHFELHNAIQLISQYLDSHTDATLRDALDRTALTYRYLLRYFIDGQEDPARRRVYSDLREDLYGIVRAIEYKDNMRDNAEQYYSVARFINHTGQNFDNLYTRYVNTHDALLLQSSNEERLQLTKQRDSLLNDIFEYIWTIPPGRQAELSRISAAAKERKDDFPLNSAIVGALSLGALKIYDRKKLITLLEMDDWADEKLSARTLAGILLIMYRHSARLKDDYSLRMLFETWTDNLLNYRRLREMVMVFIRTSGALQLTEQIQQEIMPDLMKAGPDLLNKLKTGEDSITMMDIEENPEWEEMIAKSGLKDKISRLESLQRDGADLMLMGIGRMKQMAFFNKPANWFLPFTSDNAELQSTLSDTEHEFVDTIEHLDLMCDSDKYSFLLMIKQIPEAQRRQMAEGLRAQMDQNREELKEAMLKSSTPLFDREALSYVRSLYRFFNFYRLKREFQSPFGFPFSFDTIPFLDSLLHEREIVEMVAEYYFRSKHYKESLSLFLILAEDTNEAALYEKIGYCYLQGNDPQKALGYFEKAELLNADSKWLCRNIALAADKAGEYQKSVSYYLRLLDDTPENIDLLLQLIGAMINGGGYAQALKWLHKVDYLQPDDPNIHLMINACRIHLGEYDKAVEDIESRIAMHVLSDETPSEDLLILAGNALVAKGKFKEAVSRYAEVLHTKGGAINTPSELRKRLERDWAEYDHSVYDASLIPLIADSLTS